MARTTRGFAPLGPGPIRMRDGGLNALAVDMPTMLAGSRAAVAPGPLKWSTAWLKPKLNLPARRP